MKYEIILNIKRQPNNHSKRKHLNIENIDEDLFVGLFELYIHNEMTRNSNIPENNRHPNIIVK